MENKKLEKIKDYISHKLKNDLPVNFQYLEYIEPDQTKFNMKYIKTVNSSVHNTNSYYCFEHYKPISKCINEGLQS